MKRVKESNAFFMFKNVESVLPDPVPNKSCKDPDF